MKKIITAVIFLVVLTAKICFAADSDTGNVMYEDFESGKMNFYTIADDGEITVSEDEQSQNKAIVLETKQGEASFYKNFRKTSGDFTVGFKVHFLEDRTKLRVNILSASSKPVTVLDLYGINTEENDGFVVVKPSEWVHIRLFFNIKEKSLLVKVNEKEIGHYEIPIDLLEGISGLKLTSLSDDSSNVELDNIYCYTGIDERSDYETLPDNQRILYRLEQGVAVFENRSKAIINGKQLELLPSFAPSVNSCQLIALRAAAEAFGAEVLWNGTQNAIVVKYAGKEISFFNEKNIAEINSEIVTMPEKCMIINSVTFVPLNSFAQIFGKELYTDKKGLSIISDAKIFSENSQEDVRLLNTLIKNLSGLDYIQRSDGGYLVIPDSLDETFMAQIPVQVISADYNQEGNVPQNAIDGSFDTRWSSDVDGTELTLDFGAEKRVSAIYISWMSATDRKSYFEILGSKDGVNYETVIARTESTQTTDSHEVYLIDGNYRYIRYKGYGNSANMWNSVTEIGAMEKVVQYE